jgi:hypothetical protein
LVASLFFFFFGELLARISGKSLICISIGL